MWKHDHRESLDAIVSGADISMAGPRDEYGIVPFNPIFEFRAIFSWLNDTPI